MKLEISGLGLSPDHLEAVDSGLTLVGASDLTVAVVDDFESYVRQVTAYEGYSTARGAGVVAGKTISKDGSHLIVLNAPELRARDSELVERLAAHEAGHVLLNRRHETLGDVQDLVLSEADSILLSLGSLAIDEYRIEKALANIGYPASVTGTPAYADEAMVSLNAEIMTALTDPQSADPVFLRKSVTRTHDWLTKLLSYIAPFCGTSEVPDVSVFSPSSLANWNDYIADHWPVRMAFYSETPDATVPMTQKERKNLLLDSIPIEADLLRCLGFQYETKSHGETHFIRVASDRLCDVRFRRAIDSIPPHLR